MHVILCIDVRFTLEPFKPGFAMTHILSYAIFTIGSVLAWIWDTLVNIDLALCAIEPTKAVAEIATGMLV